MTTLGRKAAFLDRDGVINRERGYLHRAEDFEFLPGAVQGLLELQRVGYLLAVVTNQSGIARGYYTVADYDAVTAHMVAELSSRGVELSGIEYCPHLPNATVPTFRSRCNCRKPEPGLVLALATRLRIDLTASVLIGDKLSDVQAGRAAGVGQCYLVRSGHELAARDSEEPDAVFENLLECAHFVAGKPYVPCDVPPEAGQF